MEQKIAVLIPAFNEGKSLGLLIPRVQKWVKEVIVVDDGSTDGTSDVARKTGAVLLHHSENLGKGAALRTGFRYLLDKGFDGCIILDGDGQHSPEDIPAFLSLAVDPHVGVILGNRMRDTSKMPLIRRWTNRCMSFFLSKFLKESMPDTQCGFKYIRSDVLRVISLNASRYDIESELLIEARKNGFRVASVPVQTIYEDEKSRIRPVRDTFFFFKLLFKKRKSLR